MSFNVIELTGHVGVAHCARLLADAGAHVVKLEPMGGDPLRASQTTYFQGLNVNNLRDPEGIALVKDMVRKADVLVQNFAIGVFCLATPALRATLGPRQFGRMKNVYKKQVVAAIENLK